MDYNPAYVNSFMKPDPEIFKEPRTPHLCSINQLSYWSKNQHRVYM